MLRIALGPCSPYSVTDSLMKRAAELARKNAGVRLHTHLAENVVRHTVMLHFFFLFFLFTDK